MVYNAETWPSQDAHNRTLSCQFWEDPWPHNKRSHMQRWHPKRTSVRQLYCWRSVHKTIILLWSRYRYGYLQCEPKKHTKMFLSYLPQNPVDSDKIWYTTHCPE